MVMIPRRLLPHQVSFKAYEGEGPRGPLYAESAHIQHAYVEEKQKLVTDTGGQEILSSTLVIVDPDWDIPEGSLVTVWAGSPRERESTVITGGLLQHPQAPSHLELRLE